MIKKINIIPTSKNLEGVKILDIGEALVNISKKLKYCIVKYEKADMIPYAGSNIWVRDTVADMLDLASRKLVSKFPDYRLKIVYGYRHPEVQKYYFEKRKDKISQNNHSISIEELTELTHTMVAIPELAGHPTGGAVDITISTISGTDIDMGTKIADYSVPSKIKTFDNTLSEEQKYNRKLLHDLMVEEGFAPYYGEWWHFSYGDREWAWFYQKLEALYDQVDFKIKKD